MDRISLIGFLRSLTRHKLYAALNIGGLAVGIAVFLVLTIYVRFENSYDRWLPGWQQTYLIEAAGPGRKLDNNSPVAMWTAIARDLPGSVGTRLYDFSATVLRNGVGVRQDLSLVDGDFAKVFPLPVVAGDFAHAFADPSNIVLTASAARKNFGTDRPIGRTITVVRNGKPQLYRVAAVVRDLPANTDLSFDMLAPLVITEDKASPDYLSEHLWNYYDPQTFVRLPDASAAQRFSDQLDGVVRRHAASETPGNPGFSMKTGLRRFDQVHFDEPGKRLAVTTIGVVGLLTLLMAIVNYVNLATARAGLRAREVAMRKVLGANRTTLLRHYVGEAMATTALAALAGLALAEATLPIVNAAADLALPLHYWGSDGVLLLLAALILGVGFAAGIYPAIILSRFPAAAVLASARSPSGGRSGARVREALVVAQFAIAIAFVIGTFVLSAQTWHVRHADVGYRREQLMLVKSLGSASLDQAKRETIMHELSRLPGVTSAAIANNAPGPGFFKSTTSVAVPGVPGNGPDLRFFQTAPGFFDTVGAHLIAGRLFDASRPADVDPNYSDVDNDNSNGAPKPYNIVINRTALRALRIPTPEAAIGRTFVTPSSPTRTIIGVVEDMRFEDARDPIPPTFYEFVQRPPYASIAMLRYDGDTKAMYAAVEQVWRRIAPEVPFDARTAVQNLDRLYRSDDRSARLFTIGAVLAVLIGCVGLWGLASFNTARRTREIGIRKTLGASSGAIVRLLIGQFLRPVLIANVVAWPLAFVAMRAWLAGFDDRIVLSPLYFIGATLLALAIAVATVGAQSLRAARAAPAWSLRHD